MDPDFTCLQLREATAPGVLAQARQLAAEVDDLDWDEHSVWGSLGQIDAGSLMLHHGFRPLAGECPYQDSGLCVHIVAVALAYLGDGDQLKDALTARARLAMASGMDEDARARTLFAAGRYAKVLERYEETHPQTHLLRVQAAFLHT